MASTSVSHRSKCQTSRGAGVVPSSSKTCAIIGDVIVFQGIEEKTLIVRKPTVDVFKLEHWTSGCTSQSNRGKKRRRELKNALKVKGIGQSLVEWVEAEKCEPSLVEVTCKHFFGP
ncbi:uncharacterized protein PV06_06608 [Exophiala oligosperma]|uniref:Uncharacterized protein n=1 Tax=Exophiala oligosperma TaxID=215243 RepID=A0A0D2AM58_9EURO|nr:uncharacterized protein PV06_06608 [Exophiala oligosperma]KIW41011.1 hypothetical protein PV06_06608 [Exophiala oligosperma]